MQTLDVTWDRPPPRIPPASRERYYKEHVGDVPNTFGTNPLPTSYYCY